MKTRRTIVTTSWDDGHQLDTKMAILLRKYNLAGTFYISPRDHEFSQDDLLSDAAIRRISRDFEIGAHTMTHQKLTKISISNARQEIHDSKTYLERVTNKKITAFCYPCGDYNQTIATLVRKEGFQLARTVNRYDFKNPDDPFQVGTSFHAYGHYSDIHKIAQFAHFDLKKIVTYTNWEYLAKDMFDFVDSRQGVFHFWGHSWEIEKFHAWDKVEHVFAHIANRHDVSYRTNTEILVI